MSNNFRHLRTLAVSLLLASTSLSGAFAQDAQQAVERFKALVEQQGATVEWNRVDIDGDEAVLVDVEIGNADDQLPIGDVTLTGISRADNGYRIAEVNFEPFVIGDQTSSIDMDAMELSGVFLPDEGQADQYGGMLTYERAYVPGLAVMVENERVFSLTELYSEMSAASDGQPLRYMGGAEEFHIDLSVVEDPSQKAMLKALGYEELLGSLTFAGYWQPSDGRFAVTEYNMTVDDAGTLGFTFDIGGYTPSFMASLRDLQAQMAADSDGSAQGLAMLGLLQQLTFHGAEISFTDDSLTGKVLEFVANSQGMKPTDVANQAKAILPFALGQLGNPELAMQVTQAVSAYLDNPENLRIKAQPADAVPFALIMAAAMSAPAELTKTLAIAVTAND